MFKLTKKAIRYPYYRKDSLWKTLNVSAFFSWNATKTIHKANRWLVKEILWRICVVFEELV